MILRVDTNVYQFQIRTWLDTDAPQFYTTPILVASEGMSRLELFKEGVMVDTVHVFRYSREELNELLVEMGQPRDESISWDKINADKEFASMMNNWSAYHEITMSPEEKAAEEEAKRVKPTQKTQEEF